MRKMSNEAAYQSAIELIEEQLQTLPMSLAAILAPPDAVPPDLTAALEQLVNEKKGRDTGSVGNIVASYAPPEPALGFRTSHHALLNDRTQKARFLRTVVGNALLAVGMFFREHGMAAMRTPEVQFLDHVCTALLNANRFQIEPGYMPIATFGGLTIDSRLNDTPLFGDGDTPGFMEFGDALALLSWLSRYLRGERHFISGGDAG